MHQRGHSKPENHVQRQAEMKEWGVLGEQDQLVQRW